MMSFTHRYLKRYISPPVAIIAILLFIALVFITYAAFNKRNIIPEPTQAEKNLQLEVSKAMQEKGVVSSAQRRIMGSTRPQQRNMAPK